MSISTPERPELAAVMPPIDIPEIVSLNIGGSHMQVSLATLVAQPESMLAKMFSGTHTLLRDEDGRFFVDSTVERFSRVLDVLRSPIASVHIDLSHLERSQLLVDLDYYNIKGMTPTEYFEAAEKARSDAWSMQMQDFIQKFVDSIDDSEKKSRWKDLFDTVTVAKVYEVDEIMYEQGGSHRVELVFGSSNLSVEVMYMSHYTKHSGGEHFGFSFKYEGEMLQLTNCHGNYDDYWVRGDENALPILLKELKIDESEAHLLLELFVCMGTLVGNNVTGSIDQDSLGRDRRYAQTCVEEFWE